MKLIPAWVLDLHEPLLSVEDVKSLRTAGRVVGVHVEVDLDAAEVAADVKLMLENYYAACRVFCQDRAAGVERVGIKTIRELGAWQQKSGKTEKKDLSEQLSCLLEAPGVGNLVEKISEKTFDADEIAIILDTLGGTWTQSGAWSELEVDVSADYEWPVALGGGASIGEVTRRFYLRFNHASWRDRKVRRLTDVKVKAIEEWPRP